MVDTPIVSEALQKDFRDNFPSQINSGRDLHVSDVIVPVVDFSTSTAISGLETSMQQALDFTVSVFDVQNTTTTIFNTPGFVRLIALFNGQALASNVFNRIQLTDGTTTKVILEQFINNGGGSVNTSGVLYDKIIFLNTGVSIQAVSSATSMKITGSARQVADLSGTLVNPDGYTGS